MEAKVRISYGTREVEVEGSEAFVREQLTNLSGTLEAFASNSSVGNAVPQEADDASDEVVAMKQNAPKAPSKLPESFGEYLSQFSKDITQDEQVLVAGYFAQCKNSDNAFATKEANDLLIEQGVKVGNASQSVTNSKKSKRLFAPQKGRFRVSPGGIDHINSLRGG